MQNAELRLRAQFCQLALEIESSSNPFRTAHRAAHDSCCWIKCSRLQGIVQAQL
jgi:hypothetical protein